MFIQIGIVCTIIKVIMDETFGYENFVTLTPHHLGNKFNPSFSSSSLTFLGPQTSVLCPHIFVDFGIFIHQIHGRYLV